MSNGSKYELRFTETNSADDSAGKTWGLEGNLFWFVVIGAFLSVLTLLLLFSMWGWSLTSAAVPAAIPLSLALLYALLLRQGKAPGYDTDLYDLWITGPGFGPHQSSTSTSEESTNSDHV